MFQLTPAETERMRTHFATASKRNERYRPYAFTEHGAIMLASVLNSPIAIRSSVHVVRAFVRLRMMLYAQKNLARRLDDLEQSCAMQFKRVFDAIEELREPPLDPPRRIGFTPD
jgi:hypothetical protein